MTLVDIVSGVAVLPILAFLGLFVGIVLLIGGTE